MSDQNLIYIAGMPEPFAVPDEAFHHVWHAIVHGDEARWCDDDGTVTRINAHKLTAVRLVPSDASKQRQLEIKAQRDREREEMEERARKRELEGKR